MEIHTPNSSVHLPALGIDFTLTDRQAFVNLGCLETREDSFRKMQAAGRDLVDPDYLFDWQSQPTTSRGQTHTFANENRTYIIMFWIGMGNPRYSLFAQGHEETHVLDDLGNLHLLLRFAISWK